MDISNLEKDVQKYFEQGLATSTRKTYQAGIKKFCQFCVVCNIQTPLPVSQSLLCLFISFLANNGLSYGTIKAYLSAVRYMHIANDYPEPEVALRALLEHRTCSPHMAGSLAWTSAMNKVATISVSLLG